MLRERLVDKMRKERERGGGEKEGGLKDGGVSCSELQLHGLYDSGSEGSRLNSLTTDEHLNYVSVCFMYQ